MQRRPRARMPSRLNFSPAPISPLPTPIPLPDRLPSPAPPPWRPSLKSYSVSRIISYSFTKSSCYRAAWLSEYSRDKEKERACTPLKPKPPCCSCFPSIAVFYMKILSYFQLPKLWWASSSPEHCYTATVQHCRREKGPNKLRYSRYKIGGSDPQIFFIFPTTGG